MKQVVPLLRSESRPRHSRHGFARATLVVSGALALVALVIVGAALVTVAVLGVTQM